MKQIFLVSLLAALMLSMAAQADDPPGPSAVGCGMVSGALISQGQGQVMINCVGVTEEFGAQLAGILTFVLQNRLDPELVIVKLGEMEGVPEGNTARTLSSDQGQAIVKSLLGKPSEEIAIVAHPQSDDGGDYAVAIATRLAMVGWRIEGNQIRRVAPPSLDEIPGLVMVVHDEKKPPEKARELKAAMISAKIVLPIISDSTLPADGALLWVGKRPIFNTATQ